MASPRRRFPRRALAIGRAAALYLGLFLLLACALGSEGAPKFLHLFASK